MLFWRCLLIIIVLLTFILAAITSNITNNNNNNLIQSSIISNEKSKEQFDLFLIPISAPSSSSAANQNECQEPCSIDYCLKYKSINKDCTRLIRDQCNCCTVCLRSENQACGGRLNVYGLCEQDLLCYKSNKTSNNLLEQTGICVKACLKYECLIVSIKNKTICECANRRVPCNINLQRNANNNKTGHYCQPQSLSQQERELSSVKTNDGKLNSIVAIR
ncbi:unnamed protein product [Rotaria socialis]|uniref:IGFBP N-terminal domain-containing protein n=1 Tax=Rotaria socialis TaxID=392032 RepID=A0A817QWB8_9BILA|nr:unnamed protein product [Rotaria socialis]CAF3314059.1 unnamed protein product [Rotaria socialis]CAF3442336.1 unnamed protein product [Rotaria socialis]CAF3566925.1 unnamed protein product [Rotaria socialis]CAF3721634.1 unnamed protein product [Rotaria socialis]